MILEGLVSTLRADGAAHLAPMGPIVDEHSAGDLRTFLLKPFQGSSTLDNLLRERAGVLHVTDDVLVLAQAAIGQPSPMPPLVTVGDMLTLTNCPSAELLLPAAVDEISRQCIVADTVRWYAFRIAEADMSQQRAILQAEVVARGTIRDFFGFNRAKHAVVEAAILATRVNLLSEPEIRKQLEPLRTAVEKTGGERERLAFKQLLDYLGTQWNTIE